MAMATTGLGPNDPLMIHFRSSGPKDLIDSGQRVPAQLSVLALNATFGTHGSRHNYKPYVCIEGELTDVLLEQPIVADIQAINLSGKAAQPVTMFYEFDHDQLVDLVNKGYFDKNVEIPDEILNTQWSLDGFVDYEVYALINENGEALPIVSIEASDGAELEVSSSDGYWLADYMKSKELAQEIVKDDEHEYSGLIADDELLFKTVEENTDQKANDSDLDQELSQALSDSQVSEGAKASIEKLLEQLAAEKQARRKAEEEAKTAKQKESSIQELYRREVLEKLDKPIWLQKDEVAAPPADEYLDEDDFEFGD